jgi:hypothetical protein
MEGGRWTVDGGRWRVTLEGHPTRTKLISLVGPTTTTLSSTLDNDDDDDLVEGKNEW